jgi:hypothetical protein
MKFMNGNRGDTIAADITGESWVAMETGQRQLARNEVAELAYHLYEVRGRQDGHDVEDWLRAEDLLARGAGAPRRYATVFSDSEGQSA